LDLSRFEGEFNAAREASLDLVELLAALAAERKTDPKRGEAIACFLSAGQGWREAGASLGGAFADQRAGKTELTTGKEQ
jgi:hypothetical protein